ncbi:DUF6571 family protein [Streptomyces sulphureus]|uniref:DUF6571 family protein n=1 Tax=Streptomyces sulphureus TaxID=47758 RepID=UPI00035F119C|nr:DUF6571 family protein [Streptomyces sulphureus]
MPTYHEIMSTKLSALTTAAQEWEDMAGEFDDQETAYRKDVHGISVGPTWTGFSALAGNQHFNDTLEQFQFAQTEAKAMAELLRKAASQFHDLREELKDVKAEAEKDDMLVSDHGVVRFDTTSLSEGAKMALHHDPTYQESVRDKERTWQRRIDAAVKKVTDADGGVETALEEASKRDLLAGGGFNGEAQGNIEKYEAKNTAEIATRINNGEATPADIREAQRAFRDNAGDKAFSQTLLNSLGPDGMVKFTNKLSDLSHSGDKGDRKDYAGLQKGLANTLATATKNTDSDFYKNWRKKMRKAGTKQFDLDVAGDKIQVGTGHGQQARGYQSLATLMKQGDGYSEDFLRDMADDIRKAEDKSQGGDPDIWDLRGDFSGKEDGWFANDPLDGVLEVMSKDPDTATHYLDPGADRGNDNLEYLLNDRDWNQVDNSTWTGNVEHTASDTHDGDVRKGFGLALEAGATGNEPATANPEMGRHTEAQARIMHDAINVLDYGDPDGRQGEDSKADADNVLKSEEYANLRGPLTRALSDYSPDTVDILAGDGPGGRTGEEGALGDGKDSQIQNSRSSVLRVMRGLSEDDENFFHLHESQQRYMAEQMGGVDPNDHEEMKNQAAKIGEVNGAVNAVGGDVDLGERDDKVGDATDKRVYGYHVVGSAVTGIPVVGDIAQRTVDATANEWLKGVTAEEGLLARDRISSGNDAAMDHLDKFFNNWVDKSGHDDVSASTLQREAGQSYTSGRESAYDALRERK